MFVPWDLFVTTVDLGFIIAPTRGLSIFRTMQCYIYFVNNNFPLNENKLYHLILNEFNLYSRSSPNIIASPTIAPMN